MKRIVVLGLVAVMLVPVSGCGGKDALMKELIANLTLCADLIEKKEPKEKVLAAMERANNTAEKLNKEKMSKEEQEALFKKYDSELKKLAERLEKAQKEWKLEGREELPPIVIDTFIKK